MAITPPTPRFPMGKRGVGGVIVDRCGGGCFWGFGEHMFCAYGAFFIVLVAQTVKMWWLFRSPANEQMSLAGERESDGRAGERGR